MVSDRNKLISMTHIFSFPLIPGTVPAQCRVPEGTHARYQTWPVTFLLACTAHCCGLLRYVHILGFLRYFHILGTRKSGLYATFACSYATFACPSPLRRYFAPPSPQVPQKIDRAMLNPPLLVQRGCLFLATTLRMRLHESMRRDTHSCTHLCE